MTSMEVVECQDDGEGAPWEALMLVAWDLRERHRKGGLFPIDRKGGDPKLNGDLEPDALPTWLDGAIELNGPGKKGETKRHGRKRTSGK